MAGITSGIFRSHPKPTNVGNLRPALEVARKGPAQRSEQTRFRIAHSTPRVRHYERLDLEAKNIATAKRILAQGHHVQDLRALERIITGLVGSGRQRLQVHWSGTPLRSASLFANWIKNTMIRNFETMTIPLLRRIIGLGDAKSSLWSHSTSQEARRIQCEQVISKLELEMQALSHRARFNPDDLSLRAKLCQVQDTLRRIKVILHYMDPIVKASLHPDALLSGEFTMLTPTEIAQLPSPISPIRGVLIRIRGPRKGNRALEIKKSAGRVSINSVKWVISDKVSLQLPSKLGIFGLYVRFVYCKWDRLVKPTARLPVLDCPNQEFSFKVE